MKTKNSGVIFISGAIFGLALALCLGAEQKPKAGQTNQTPAQVIPAPTPQGLDRARLQVFSYPNGTTGIFEPESSTIYVYDANLDRCYLIRQIVNLGAPLRNR